MQFLSHSTYRVRAGISSWGAWTGTLTQRDSNPNTFLTIGGNGIASGGAWVDSISNVDPFAGGGATAPAAFTSGQWSVSDLGTDGDIRINVTELPSDGGDPITDLEYQLDTGAWTTMNRTTTVTFDIPNLTNGQSYDVKVRAVNNTGQGTDSDTKTVTPTAPATPVLPTVTTQAASAVSQTTATLNGNVTSDGGDSITERGFYWSASPNVTDADTKVVVSGTTGAFSTNLSGLTASTPYYYRSFAANGEGEQLDSSDTSFSTLAASTGDRYQVLVGNGSGWDKVN